VLLTGDFTDVVLLRTDPKQNSGIRKQQSAHDAAELNRGKTAPGTASGDSRAATGRIVLNHFVSDAYRDP